MKSNEEHIVFERFRYARVLRLTPATEESMVSGQTFSEISRRVSDTQLRRQLAIGIIFRLMFNSVSAVHANKIEGSNESFVLEALRTLNTGRLENDSFNFIRGLSLRSKDRS
jgi:hypothetical protein